MTQPQRQPHQATAPEVPVDLSDPEHVADRKKAAKEREDTRAAGLKYIMGDRRGRAWMRHLIAEKLFTRVGRQRPAGIFTGNSTTFYNSALKELGDIISAEVATLTPTEFRLMEDEGDGHAVRT
jgi:hypothetical protein